MIRVALVVGGASGIGRATASMLASAGFVVASADVSKDAADVSHLGAEHRGYLADVADEASVVRLFEAVEGDLGPIAVLVGCAGITGYIDGKRPSLRETTLESWNRVIAVNGTGMFLCLREFLRRRAAFRLDDARVVLIGSMAAQDGGKNSPPAYVASKGAVHALVKAAMNEAAVLGVTVNCIAPGVIDTPLLRSALPVDKHAAAFAQMPLGRAGLPQEVAAAVAFLTSREASFVTGAIIDVNGGVRLS